MIVRNKNTKKITEADLSNFLYKKKFIEIHNKNRKEPYKIKCCGKEVAPFILDDFRQVPGLIEPIMLVTKKRPWQFDLTARPIPKRQKAVIIELKKGRLQYKDLRQLLGYINYFRKIQKYGGQEGLDHLSQFFDIKITKRTKLEGILIGRRVNRDLLHYIPEEIWRFIHICTFSVKTGKRAIREVRIKNKGQRYLAEQESKGKKLMKVWNPTIPYSDNKKS